MVRSSISSFFDELDKIATAGDLMSPAVVSDSATVDGPPATPFTRRKGYSKLEKQQVIKEAGIGRDFLDWAKRRHQQVKGIVGKVGQHYDNAAGAVDRAVTKGYVKLPHKVQKVVSHPALWEPSDPSAGVALGAVKHLIKTKLGSKKRRR